MSGMKSQQSTARQDDQISRRAFLAGAVVAATAAIVPPIYAQKSAKTAISPTLPAQDIATIEAIVAQIVPTDATPGAKDAGVAQAIVNQVKASPRLTTLFEKGLAELNTVSMKKADTSFAAISSAEQTAVLLSIQDTEFFRTIRNMTIRSFYGSKAGARTVGYPGAGQPMGHPDFAQPPANGR